MNPITKPMITMTDRLGRDLWRAVRQGRAPARLACRASRGFPRFLERAVRLEECSCTLRYRARAAWSPHPPGQRAQLRSTAPSSSFTRRTSRWTRQRLAEHVELHLQRELLGHDVRADLRLSAGLGTGARRLCPLLVAAQAVLGRGQVRSTTASLSWMNSRVRRALDVRSEAG